MVSCMTPIRKGGGMTLVLGRGGGALGLGLVGLGRERADAFVRAARPGLGLRDRRPLGRRGGLLNLVVERREDVLDLLVDDRLEHALAHPTGPAMRTSASQSIFVPP